MTIPIKNKEGISKMREACAIAATVLEGKQPRVLGWDDGDAALELIRSSAT